MTRENIITALKARGVEAEASETTKNNVRLEGITIGAGPVRPMVYTDDLLKEADARGLDVEAVAEMIIEKYAAEMPDINLARLTNADYIREHIMIGLQRATNEEIIKKACPLDEAIEAYLYITIDAGGDFNASAKVKPSMLDAAGIDAAEAWRLAELNTYATTTIDDISAVLAAMGAPVYDDTPPFKMFVLSNQQRSRGASAILDRETLAKFAADHNTHEIVAIPSSIHEWLIIPAGAPGIDEVSKMVQEVNVGVVDPVEQLADRAYTLTF